MGEIAYCKCPCKECGNNIEFPAYAARTTVPCPHCGQWTELLLPETVAEPKRMDVGTMAIICCALLVAGWALWLQFRKKPAEDDSVPTSVVKVVPKPVAKAVVAPTNLPPANVPPAIVVTQAVVQAPVTPTRPKSPDDLKIMHRVTADQRASGFQARMPKLGQPGPAFTLASQDGMDVSSAALVARGPVVISFFRGRW